MANSHASCNPIALRACLLAACAFSTLAVAALAQEPIRKLGTIGPPPRKNPERQTSAEAFPPLPLPVTPLRRSEPKAEPAPPLFAAKLAYGKTQDYMPNPGDLDNLMRYARAEIGLWYGSKVQDLDEMAAIYERGGKLQIPMLYLTGYESFELTESHRNALRQHLLDGGTLVADATLGSPEFAASLRREVLAMFPDRSFDRLQVDHPLFRAFHAYTNAHYFDVEGGTGFQTQGPPEFFGMNLGTRTAILFSPCDLSCGWDEFIAPSSKARVPQAPRGKAMLPGDAVRMGMNLVSYVAALREVAEVESVTNELALSTSRARQTFSIAQLRHHGDWNPDPNSGYQWLRHLALESSLAIDPNLREIDAHPAKLADYPFVFLTGLRDPKLNDDEKASLQCHLAAGGFLFINNCSGYHEFDQHIRILLGEIFPDQSLTPIPQDHELFRSFYKIEEVRDRRTGASRQAELEGIAIRDRLVVVYSKNDAVTHLKQLSDPFGNGYDAESCRQLAVNVVAYALQH